MKQEISDLPTPAGKEVPTGRNAWLAALLLRRPDWPARFVAVRRQLALMARPKRRWLMRRAAVTLTGAALLLSLACPPAPVHAATIVVDETICTLVDAIRAANTDTAVGGCTTGGGDDIIDLQADVNLTTSYGHYFYSDTGLPLVTSNITINGNNHVVARTSVNDFRILALDYGVNVTINDTTISNGASQSSGGGIYSAADSLVINGSTVSGNDADGGRGGGIFHQNGDLTISGSTVSGNDADDGGGLYFRGEETSVATITGARFEDNEAYLDGGAIYHDSGVMIIVGSVITGNTADSDGGAIYQEFSPLTIIRSTISYNDAAGDGGGVYADGPFTLVRSTVNNNTASYNGGGVHVDDTGSVEITNSTISGNEAGDAGGVYFDETEPNNDYGNLSNTIANTTVTGNVAGGAGGGLYTRPHYDAAQVTLEQTIISGNTATDDGDEVYAYDGNVSADAFNVFGHDGLSDADAFFGFTPGASDFNATTDGTPTALVDILDTTLADNGGPTETHALPTVSPAIDFAPSGGCTIAPTDNIDQRGAGRNFNADGIATANECDAGAVEQDSPVFANVFVTTEGAGTTADGVAFTNRDILSWDGSDWSRVFTGGNFGLTKHDLTSADVVTPDDLYFSLLQNKINVPGVGNVFGNDIVHFDGTDFDLFFDGSDVGLTTAKEKVDAFDILDGSASPIGAGCVAYILVSTNGSGQVAAFGGGAFNFRNNDILGFCATSLGPNTAGSWHKVLDGNAAGLPASAIIALSATPDAGIIMFTTKAGFNVPPAFGGHSMIYAYDQANGSFSGPLWRAADNGLSKKVDGLHVSE